MSFRSQSPVTSEPGRGWEASRAEPMSFLSPERASEGGAQAQHDAEFYARKRTLRTLNALRVVGPLLGAVMERPGPLAPDEEIAQAFKTLVASASQFSSQAAQKMGVDPSDSQLFWVRNVLERIFADALKEQWTKRGSADLEPLRGPLETVLEMDWPTGEQEFESLSLDLAVRAALVRAGTPVLVKAQTGFDFFRNMRKEIEPIMARLMGAAAKGTLALCDEGASERDRASLFSVLIAEAGTLYATAWWAMGKKAVEDLAQVPDAELKAILRDYPDGLPIDRVNTAFDKNFERLVQVACQLAPSTAPKSSKPGRKKVPSRSTGGASSPIPVSTGRSSVSSVPGRTVGSTASTQRQEPQRKGEERRSPTASASFQKGPSPERAPERSLLSGTTSSSPRASSLTASPVAPVKLSDGWDDFDETPELGAQEHPRVESSKTQSASKTESEPHAVSSSEKATKPEKQVEKPREKAGETPKNAESPSPGERIDSSALSDSKAA